MEHRLGKFHRHSSLANGHGRAGVLSLSLPLSQTYTHSTQGKRGEDNTKDESGPEKREREDRETKLLVSPGKRGAPRSDAPHVHVSFYSFLSSLALAAFVDVFRICSPSSIRSPIAILVWGTLTKPMISIGLELANPN